MPFSMSGLPPPLPDESEEVAVSPPLRHGGRRAKNKPACLDSPLL